MAPVYSEVLEKSDWLIKLPPEILERIILRLPALDILTLGQCCLRLKEISRNERIWENLAKRDYKVSLKRGETSKNQSARHLYFKLLMPYGPLLHETFHRTNFTFYGGLMKFVYYDCSIYVVEMDPPIFPYVCKNLQPQIVCKLSLDTNNTETILKFDQETTDFGKVKSLNITKDAEGKIQQIGILSTPSTLPFMQNLEIEIAHWLEADSETIPKGVLYLQQYGSRLGLSPNMAYAKFQHRIEFLNEGVQKLVPLSSLKDPYRPPFCPICPGLFKGTYSGHGIEIINLMFKSNDENVIFGEKVYGDPNVPCSQLTFKGCMDKSMTLTRSDQFSIEQITQYMASTYTTGLPSCDAKPNYQPFVLPSGCDCDYPLDEDFFRKALWRFQATCQISDFMYENPEWIEGNLIIFSEDIFGVIFIAESYGFVALSIFHRVKENLSAIHYQDVFNDLPVMDEDI